MQDLTFFRSPFISDKASGWCFSFLVHYLLSFLWRLTCLFFSEICNFLYELEHHLETYYIWCLFSRHIQNINTFIIFNFALSTLSQSSEFHGSVWLARASGWLMIFTLKIGCSRESVVFQLEIQKVKSVQIEFQTSTNKFPTTLHYISLYRYYILYLVIYSSMVFLSSSSSLLSKSYMNVIGGETYFRNTIFKLTLNSLRKSVNINKKYYY